MTAKKAKKGRLPLRVKPGTTIQNCNFTALEFDPGVVKSVDALIEACRENTRVLHAVADIFKASNVSVDTMIRIAEEPKP